MKIFKKKLVQRLSCVCCAVAFAIFSVFSICDLSGSRKNEVISASAEESVEDFPKFSYDIIIPSGFIFKTKSSSFLLTIYRFSLKPSAVISSPFSITISTMGVGGSAYFESFGSNDSSPYSYTNFRPLVLSIDFYEKEQLFIELSNLTYDNGLYPIYINSEYSFESGWAASKWSCILSPPTGFRDTIALISEQSISQPIYIRQNSVYTQSDIDSSYEQGYNVGNYEGFASGIEQGLETGYNEGYKVGKEEAEEKYKRGLFASFENVEVYAYDSLNNYLFSAEADYGVNAVSFGSAVETLERWNYENQVSPAYYKVMFVTGHGYEHEIPIEMLEILAYGDSSIFGQENSFIGQGSDYYTQTWRGYPMYFDTSQDGDGYPLVIEYNNIDPHLSRARLNNFAVTVPNLSLLRNMQFVATSGYYSQGYSQGVVDGYQNGLTDGEKVGYDKGYMYGENVGYNRGVGDSGEYTFLGLFTAVVDAPIKAFLGLLDFEILGMDMQKFFLSILTAALCIAVYRLFSGSAA